MWRLRYTVSIAVLVTVVLAISLYVNIAPDCSRRDNQILMEEVKANDLVQINAQNVDEVVRISYVVDRSNTDFSEIDFSREGKFLFVYESKPPTGYYFSITNKSCRSFLIWELDKMKIIEADVPMASVRVAYLNTDVSESYVGGRIFISMSTNESNYGYWNPATGEKLGEYDSLSDLINEHSELDFLQTYQNDQEQLGESLLEFKWQDEILRVFDPSNNQVLQIPGLPDTIIDAELSKDTTMLAIVVDDNPDRVEIWAIPVND